jgi:hypothetical protein
MANDPPFATLNHFAADLGIPSESDLLRIGISGPLLGRLRVTGDVEATSTVTNAKTGNIVTSMSYTLKCSPTQRMF